MDYNDVGQPDAVHYGHITAVNTKAIQDLKAVIDAQAALIADLTSRIEALEK